MYYILNSSKGLSSVFLGRLIGVKQNTAWKMGHAIRLMMDSWAKELPLLSSTIEIDETFFGGNPRFHYGVRYKDGKGTSKQNILVAIQRQGPVFPVPVNSMKTDHITPIIESVADTSANLMTDRGSFFTDQENCLHVSQHIFRAVHIYDTAWAQTCHGVRRGLGLDLLMAAHAGKLQDGLPVYLFLPIIATGNDITRQSNKY